jgi:single-strand DNA-binding protein
MSCNIVILEGNLGDDVEIRTVGASEQTLAKLRVATSRRYVTNGEEKEVTDWHTVVAWGKLGDRCESLSKGMFVSIRGRLSTRSYDKDGQKRYVTEVVADSVAVTPQGGATRAALPPPRDEYPDEDVPF